VAGYLWDWDVKMPGGFYVMRSEAVGWPPRQEFNGDGLRDRTRPREKTEGLWRVAVLGDSVTLGDGIRPHQAYPQRLEARLRAQGQRVEVMNVALWGWSTRQQRTAWQKIAREYHPDQVILAICLNDIAELHNNLARPPRWLIRLHESSALVRLLVDAGGREIEDVERLFETPDAPQVRAALDRFFEEVRALRKEVEVDGATFSAVVFPFRFQLEEDGPEPVAQERIAAFCEAEGIPCLDLLPTLQRAGITSFSDYDHLSPSGSALTADTLLTSGLLPDGYANPSALEGHFRGKTDAGAAAILRWLEEGGSPPGAAGVRALATLLESGDLGLRLAAAWALETLGPEAQSATRNLIVALGGDAAPGVRAAAARSFPELGEGGRVAVPALFEALDDPSEAVRHAAAQTLAELKLTAEEIPRLERALQSDDVYVRAFAAWRLGNFREDAREAVPALAAALERPKTYVAVSAALARVGPAATEAVTALVAELSSDDLVEALNDPNEGVRFRAARALGQIGPEARSAAAALQQATGDPDAGVRREAQKALERLH
jgi:HEAT repeat protein